MRRYQVGMQTFTITADLTSSQADQLRALLADAFPDLASQVPHLSGQVEVTGFFAVGVLGTVTDGVVEFHTGPMAGTSLPLAQVETYPGVQISPAAAIEEGREWTRIRVRTTSALNPEEQRQAAALLGYAFKQCHVHAHFGPVERVSDHEFYLDSEWPVSYPVDLASKLRDAYDTLLVEGSPVRTTNRAGAGTAGTRLVEGFGHDGDPEAWLTLE